MAITLLQLHYLAAVAERGSVTAAAQHLGVTQPVLSRAIAMLQKELHTTIFHRVGRKLVLSPEGEAILSPALRTLESVEDIRRTARTRRRRQVLKVTTGSIMAGMLADDLKRFLGTYPDVQLQFASEDVPDAITEMLLQGQTHLGFGFEPTARQGLQWVPYGAAELVLISPASEPLPDEIDVADLPHIRLVSKDLTLGRRRLARDMWIGEAATPQIQVEDIVDAFSLVRGGLGSGLSWRFHCEGIPGLRIRSFKPRQFFDVGFFYLDPIHSLAKGLLEATKHGERYS